MKSKKKAKKNNKKQQSERERKEKLRNLHSNKTNESSHAKWWHERLRDFTSRMILYRRIWLDKKVTNRLKHVQYDVTLDLATLPHRQEGYNPLQWSLFLLQCYYTVIKTNFGKKSFGKNVKKTAKVNYCSWISCSFML